MVDPGAGILDCLHTAGKNPKVGVAASFLPGMKVTLCRAVKGIEPSQPLTRIKTLTIDELPVDEAGNFTNEIVFREPLPHDVKVGDLILYEGFDGK